MERMIYNKDIRCLASAEMQKARAVGFASGGKFQSI